MLRPVWLRISGRFWGVAAHTARVISRIDGATGCHVSISRVWVRGVWVTAMGHIRPLVLDGRASRSGMGCILGVSHGLMLWHAMIVDW